MALKYFTESNSAAGYINLQDDNLTGILQIYHLQSPDGKLVDRLLKDLLLQLPKEALPELIYSAFNPEYLAGIILREQEVAFTSGERVPQNAQVLALANLYNGSILKKNQPQINELQLKMREQYKKMYMHLNAALLIHDEWESIYIDRLDRVKADNFKKDFLVRLFNGDIPPSKGKSHVVSRFFGASTPSGLVDFIPELTAGLRRILIKGRPGSGKSTLMRAVLAKAVELGYDADVYYCSLDPKSLDMVVIPELNFCIFDATAPHEYEPSFAADEVVDTYKEFIKPGTDERWATVIMAIEAKYNNQIRQARIAMKAGHEYRTQISDLYREALMLAQYHDVLIGLVNLIN